MQILCVGWVRSGSGGTKKLQLLKPGNEWYTGKKYWEPDRKKHRDKLYLKSWIRDQILFQLWHERIKWWAADNIVAVLVCSNRSQNSPN